MSVSQSPIIMAAPLRPPSVPPPPHGRAASVTEAPPSAAAAAAATCSTRAGLELAPLDGAAGPGRAVGAQRETAERGQKWEREDRAAPGDAAARPGDWRWRPAAASKGPVLRGAVAQQAGTGSGGRRGTAVAGMAGPVRRGRD